jgi:hypothetical protein
MRRTRIRSLAIALTAVGLLALACGGNDGRGSDGSGDGGGDAAEESSPVATSQPTATDGTPPTAVPTPEPRPDGLTGAPVELPGARSTDFDIELLNVNAGTFPPLDYPRLATVEEAMWLADDALVLGAVQNGESRAYPLSMMRFHHVANDELGGEPYLVTF